MKSQKIAIDTNALIVLLLGLMRPKLISTHKRSSIYEIADFKSLIHVIRDLNRLVVLPNVWTEVDNVLNDFTRGDKWRYITEIKNLIQTTSETYIESTIGVNNHYFVDIGMTDSLLLELAVNCDFIITADSKLSDRARSQGIQVYDMVFERNRAFKSNSG